MDIQSETIHCTEGDFIMILPDVVHSFYLNDTSDCEFQHIHYDPDMFSTVVLEDDGIVPDYLASCYPVFFAFLLQAQIGYCDRWSYSEAY